MTKSLFIVAALLMSTAIDAHKVGTPRPLTPSPANTPRNTPPNTPRPSK